MGGVRIFWERQRVSFPDGPSNLGYRFKPLYEARRRRYVNSLFAGGGTNVGFYWSSWATTGRSRRMAGVPVWCIVLAPALLTAAPGGYLWHLRRRRRLRLARNLCPTCGYDLGGAAHERCPECGAGIVPQPV